MTSEIIVALVGIVGSIGGAIISGITTSKLMVWRIEQLEKRVEVHNNLVERMTKVEVHETTQDVNIQENKKDIDALWNTFRAKVPQA